MAPTASNPDSPFKVLLLKRASKATFMPNLYVFPGGAADSADASAAWERAPLSPPAHSFAVPVLRDAVQQETVGDRVCALRETFEETGILLSSAGSAYARSVALAQPFLSQHVQSRVEDLLATYNAAAAAAEAAGTAPPPHPSAVAAAAAAADLSLPLHTRAQKRVLTSGAFYQAMCEAAGLVPPVDAVLPLARWVTPKNEAKRYATSRQCKRREFI